MMINPNAEKIAGGTASQLVFVHRYEAPEGGTRAARTLLLLHGTGGNENDLPDLARELSPADARLSVRGRVLENGMPRFFRRLREGVFDEADLRFRAEELAKFIGAAAHHYGFDAKNVWALGYSNGANIAAATLLLHPRVLAGAVLLRAMVPLVPDAPEETPRPASTRVLLCSGNRDPIVPRDNADQLALLLRESGAQITQHFHDGGHEIGLDDLDVTRDFLAA